MKHPVTFQPRRWLSNGHLQTITGNFLARKHGLGPAITEFVRVPLPAEMLSIPRAVELDERLPSYVLCHCHWQPVASHAVTVILLHGLEGSSQSHYMLGNARKFFAAGCNVIRMNMRNCGNTDAMSSTLYHSGMSTDVTALMHWAVQRGCDRIVLAGYSMGGNLMLKAAGELGAHPHLAGVAAISPPIDLRESADALHHWSNRGYEHHFLRRLIARYQRKSAIFPAVFDPQRTDRVRSIRNFDEFAMAPNCGFAGADDYYQRAASSSVLERIAVPTLVIHALDDPFIRLTAKTRDLLHANPRIRFVESTHGGHCAFLEHPAEDYDGYWAERALLHFVQAISASNAHDEVPFC